MITICKRIHNKAATHASYPLKFDLPPDEVPWDIATTKVYTPEYFTHPAVLAADSSVPGSAGWADPESPELPLKGLGSYSGPVLLDAGTLLPLNPVGRTGVKGRGLLGKWGANFAADPIVTRFHPDSKDLIQVVVIKRKDGGEWALPGGMADKGELVSQTVRREFIEEAGNIADPEAKAEFEQNIKQLFETGKIVYRGYVDDPRNTDNAWIETAAFHFHCSEDLALRLHLEAGDDAAAVTWIDANDQCYEYVNLYASHKQMVDKAVASLRAEPDPAEQRPAKRCRQ
jgi:ADP-ribose pyrophosphatase